MESKNHQNDERPVNSNAENLAPSRAPRALKVLCVEDQSVNRMLTDLVLEKWGHTVTNAVDGVEALAKFQAAEFDVVLMDLQMPNMDGLEATRLIRQLEQDNSLKRTPIIAMTANVTARDRERCLAAGMDEHFPKPISLKNLHSFLDCL
jgi:two-component system, sensor histidine kinase and response regulator